MATEKQKPRQKFFPDDVILHSHSQATSTQPLTILNLRAHSTMSSNNDPDDSPRSNRRRQLPSVTRRRNNQNNPDAELKEQMKAERRAQIMREISVNDQDTPDRTDGTSASAVGDDITAARTRSQRNDEAGSSPRSRGSDRPSKGRARAAPSQVGAVAIAGRAFGAPRRPSSVPQNLTRSLVLGDGFEFGFDHLIMDDYDSDVDIIASGDDVEINLVAAAVVAPEVEDMEEEIQYLRTSLEETQKAQKNAEIAKMDDHAYGSDPDIIATGDDVESNPVAAVVAPDVEDMVKEIKYLRTSLEEAAQQAQNNTVIANVAVAFEELMDDGSSGRNKKMRINLVIVVIAAIIIGAVVWIFT